MFYKTLGHKFYDLLVIIITTHIRERGYSRFFFFLSFLTHDHFAPKQRNSVYSAIARRGSRRRGGEKAPRFAYSFAKWDGRLIARDHRAINIKFAGVTMTKCRSVRNPTRASTAQIFHSPASPSVLLLLLLLFSFVVAWQGRR